MIGAAGIVTAAALTGASVFGFHLGSKPQTVAIAEAPTTTEETVDPQATEPPTTDTLPPVVVVQTEFVDQYVTLTVPAAPVAYQAAPPADPEPDPTPTETQPTAPPTAATQPPATAAPATDPPATDPPTTEATTAPTVALTTTSSTLFDKAKYPFKVSIPSDWGSKPIPNLPTPTAGKQWQECELHSWGWACQYP
jgi:hypothetical protein